jgi:AraC-like DNA-binding protein
MNKDLLKENRIHGDVMFPFGIYTINCTIGHILDCHWHEELEFLLVTQGKAVFQIDALFYEVTAGQGIFVNSGEIHAGYPLDDSACSFCAVVFHPELLCSGSYDVLQSKYIDPILKKQYELPKHIKAISEWEKEVLLQLEEIIRLSTIKPYSYELLVKARLYLVFSSILSNNSLILSNKEYSADNYNIERIKTAIQFIQANYGSKISTKDLAILLNLSEGYFCRLFKQLVKKTPIDYLNYYRVNKAIRLLEDTDKKVIDIAMEVGFDNFSYFIGTFKHYTTCTPAKYRNMSQR